MNQSPMLSTTRLVGVLSGSFASTSIDSDVEIDVNEPASISSAIVNNNSSDSNTDNDDDDTEMEDYPKVLTYVATLIKVGEAI
ncbi:hypothetical protein EGR_09936 [Echinococcus granulosus]|uniref:Uncharacterized protein n=1 Tax=Echinococcus granulosus TaxID=6210 RepID=W6U259_ECHGR|nr:hypothetical protein EGR_09936 [Echinococcus granulosus]EUB55195.1 hypothetical protein EGR_09936 [Echinococcus granulosus]